MLLSLILWAQDGGGGGAPAPRGPFGMDPFMIIMMLVAIFLFTVIIPSSRRQQRERDALLKATEKNDLVLTSGGIYATVVSISEDKDEMIVRLEGDVKVKMTRSCVVSNLTKQEKAKEAAAGQQASKEPAK